MWPTIASIISTNGRTSYLLLERRERAFVVAAVTMKLESDKKAARRAKAARRK